MMCKFPYVLQCCSLQLPSSSGTHHYHHITMRPIFSLNSTFPEQMAVDVYYAGFQPRCSTVWCKYFAQMIPSEHLTPLALSPFGWVIFIYHGTSNRSSSIKKGTVFFYFISRLSSRVHRSRHVLFIFCLSESPLQI
jgi:hypothetical protein